MALAPSKTPSSSHTSSGTVIAVLCVTLAILIFICVLLMSRTPTLAMVQEHYPKSCLPGDHIDSIPIAKYATAKMRYLAGDVARKQPNIPKDIDALSYPSSMTKPRANLKDTIQQYWSMLRRSENANTAEHPPRDAQQACPTCTEDFLDEDDVRMLPCEHLFHPRCIDPWFRSRAITCPLWQVSQLHSGIDLG